MPGPDRTPAGVPPLRLDFLDGLRGLAALYIVLHHAAVAVDGPFGRGAALVRRLFQHGHFAVGVFIVLSGYCLMLPVARDPAGRLRGGTLAYLGRRARRILPPYYAALALCCALIALAVALRCPEFARWDRTRPAFDVGVIGSHLLLAHNLNSGWITRIDPPMWSVATEWQIYLLFPGLLVLWRRRGIAVTVAVAFVVGYGLAALAGWFDLAVLYRLCPWYLGLFALGMAGATALPLAKGQPRPGQRWILAVVLVATALVLEGLARGTRLGGWNMLTDLVVGLATLGLIVRCARLAGRGKGVRRSLVLRLLESRGAVALGECSYSLYLTHFPVVVQANGMLEDRGWGPEIRLAALLLVVAPLCLLAAWLFHLAFERRAPWVRQDVGARPGMGSFGRPLDSNRASARLDDRVRGEPVNRRPAMPFDSSRSR